MSKLIKALRGSDDLLKEFRTSHNDVSKRYGLALTEEERDKVAEVATAVVADELSTDALEAVAGGDVNGSCPVSNTCPAPSPGPKSW